MDKKRVVMAIIGIPVVGLILTCGNQIIIDVFTTIIAILAMKEYFIAISKKGIKPIKWIGYSSCLLILLEHIFFSIDSIEIKQYILILILPIILSLSFLQVIISNMKTNMNDMIYTIFGIIYIVFPLLFMTLIRSLDKGKILIWYFIIASWGTDIFAYIIGKKIGKHKLSKISPNKSIEGCITGVIGAVLVAIIYTLIVTHFGYIYPYYKIIYTTILLSVISQLGDFAASCIKRYVDIKDYGKMIPGHGGVLDRIDSMMYIAPFAYIMLKIL